MITYKCHSQHELEAAIKKADECDTIELYGDEFFVAGSSTVRAYGSSTVRACGSSTVTAYGSSTVMAYDSSTVRACDSSTVRACGSSTVMACGSSTVMACGSSTVTAYDSSTVMACGSSTVRAGKYVAVHKMGRSSTVEGGVVIERPEITDIRVWCDVYGVPIDGDHVVLFKAVNDDYTSPHGTSYKPGAVPIAEDWDGGRLECGGGLHFSPRPAMAIAFHPEATRFVACPVAIRDISVKRNANMPEKVKARGCCAPVWECDIDGNRMGGD